MKYCPFALGATWVCRRDRGRISRRGRMCEEPPVTARIAQFIESRFSRRSIPRNPMLTRFVIVD